jgi:hypothetical protein
VAAGKGPRVHERLAHRTGEPDQEDAEARRGHRRPRRARGAPAGCARACTGRSRGSSARPAAGRPRRVRPSPPGACRPRSPWSRPASARGAASTRWSPGTRPTGSGRCGRGSPRPRGRTPSPCSAARSASSRTRARALGPPSPGTPRIRVDEHDVDGDEDQHPVGQRDVDEEPALQDKLHRPVEVERVLLAQERGQLGRRLLLALAQVALDLPQVREQRVDRPARADEVRPRKFLGPFRKSPRRAA